MDIPAITNNGTLSQYANSFSSFNLNEPLWSVYRWYFPETDSVYIGLSTNVKSRIQTELRQGTVYDHIRSTGDSYSISIIAEKLTATEAATLESEYIEASRLAGYNVINKLAGGGLGAIMSRTDESILEEITSNYTSVKELRTLNPTLYMMVKRHKLCSKVSSLLKRGKRYQLTKEIILDAVKQCTTYAEFQYKFPSEYQAAHNNHWDDLIKDLPRRNKKASDYSYEHIYECAHQCSTRTEFNKQFRSESYAAKKLGIYDEIVADMPKQSKWSKQKVTAPTDPTGAQD
jgi:hypothetical protein